MQRRLRVLAISAAVLTAGLALVAACSRKEEACTVDSDCPPGSFCRGGVCAPAAGIDAGGSVDGQVPITPCLAPGASCTLDEECCTRPCNAFRCAGGAGSSGTSSSGASGTSGASSGTTSGGASCTDLYGLCASDFECCAGLACTSGSCR